MKPKVSIVTISYNQALYLERCLQSVLSQSYDDVEYIVVDGGSTDGSVEILERYRDNIDVLIIEGDAGPADALNKGFAVAKGDILGFLNSDDELTPFAISDFVSAFERLPGYDVLSANGLLVDGDGRLLRRLFSDQFTMRRSASGAAYLIQPSTFFRSIAFKQAGGFNVANRSTWDTELWFDMSMMGARFARIEGYTSVYRLHELSITSSAVTRSGLQGHHDAMFKKAFGRRVQVWDRPGQMLQRVLRHIRNPRGFAERLFYGPISGRG